MCKTIHDIMKCDILANRIIPDYVEIYDYVVHKKSLGRVCSLRAVSKWTVKYFSNPCNRYLLEICHPVVDNVQQDCDIIILFNYYSSATL